MCDYLGLGQKIYQRHPGENKNNWYTSVGGRRQVYSIMQRLYDNATVYLERKYEHYLNMQDILNSLNSRLNEKSLGL